MKKSFEIELSNEAENDFGNAFSFYSLESTKIANSFFQQIDYGLTTISENPFYFQKAHKDIRRFVVRKFPFVIYYFVQDKNIKVVSIFHTSRNPQIWKRRIK
ncbi:MAG: type II toxin-antitoxin system RelE/ParE family toxin [Bacteroidales bacterium]|nr:type II toxin-antitoxin system RelE/ParE family toxin [Bacteroidales bacterium]